MGEKRPYIGADDPVSDYSGPVFEAGVPEENGVVLFQDQNTDRHVIEDAIMLLRKVGFVHDGLNP